MYELRFLACVDLLGTTYSASALGTGYGAYMAVPILRNEVEGREDILTEEEALGILDKWMKVLFYPAARSTNKGLIVPLFIFVEVLFCLHFFFIIKLGA